MKDSGDKPLADSQGQWAFSHTEAEGKERALRKLQSLRRGSATFNSTPTASGSHLGACSP